MASTGPAASGAVPIEVRPPFETSGDEVAPPPGAATLPFRVIRPTAAVRPVVEPRLWSDGEEGGYPTDHRYVRRYWTAAIGPGAVADLIRLAVAARRDRSLPLPVHLPLLVSEGLCRLAGTAILVRPTVPPLSPRLVAGLHPALRREHARFVAG